MQFPHRGRAPESVYESTGETPKNHIFVSSVALARCMFVVDVRYRRHHFKENLICRVGTDIPE
ncbi:MAG: hypothetical protein ACI9X0_001943, partial [Kiritimatiellia bacterium]